MGKYYEKEGVKMAIELYEELNLPEANTRDITKTIYQEINSAIKHCGLTNLQHDVLHHRYTKRNPVYSVGATADILDIAPNKVSEYTGDAIDKIHAYMNGERDYDGRV